MTAADELLGETVAHVVDDDRSVNHLKSSSTVAAVPSQLLSLSSFCSVFADPFCSAAGSSTMADFFDVPVGLQVEVEGLEVRKPS